MRRNICVIITVLVVLSFLLACAQPVPTVASVATTAPAAATQAQAAASTAAPVAKIKRGGTLRIGYNEEWAPNLDPHQITSPPYGFEMLYDTLTRVSLDVKTGKRTLKPGLAESWDQQSPKILIMKLRKDVTFQDGSKFNAEVAKFNLDRMRTFPKSASKTDMLIVDSVDVVDEYTIRINLKAAPAGILYRLADNVSLRPWIVSKAAADQGGDEAFTRRSVGSGCMQFVEWLTGDRITMKKWDKYWDKGADGQPLPYADGAVLRVIMQENVGVTEVRTGNMDAFDAIEPHSFPGVSSTPDIERVEYPWHGQVNYLIFNLKKPPFDNLKLRQAALYAIDRENAAKAGGMGIGQPAYYYWGAGDLGYDASLPHYSFDLNKAKQLVTEAGFPNGVSVTDEFFHVEELQRSAESFKQTWDQAGIKTTLNSQERTAFVSKLQVGDFQVANSSRFFAEVDPDMYSYRLTSTGTYNFAHFENQEMDKCMEDGRSAVEDSKRADIYKRCQQIVFEQAPYDSYWYRPIEIVISQKLKGWEPHTFSRFTFREAWLDK
jgi:peptide/nickel transport system substrate-binding protein